MRKALVAAVALAPICLAIGRSPANAADNVTSGVNSPIATATATSGGPDDINIEGGGSVSVSGTTPAVTLNSNNSITNAGSISINGVNNSTAVLLQGGFTSAASSTPGTAFNNSGAITNGESFSPSTNGDGFTTEPFANPTSMGRYGVRLTGAAPLVGNFTNSGTITVQGNASYAVSLEAPLDGSFTNTGTISVVGDNTVGIRSTAGSTISGDVLLTGTTSATGAGSSAINLQGDVGGRLSVYSAITATAYASTTRPTTTNQLQNVQTVHDSTGTLTQVEQSNAAMIIGGNVGGGIFVGAPPVTTTAATTADLDGDGNIDSLEGTGSITNFGSAPALLIGSANGSATTIGNFVPAAGTTGLDAGLFGVVIRGSVSGLGLYDGVPATGLQIGTGADTVSIPGGVRVVGSVTADSYQGDVTAANTTIANATAIHLFSGATVGAIQNEDFIEASVTRSVLATTEVAATATAIQVDPGATLSSLTNYGTIQATVNGDNKSAFGVVDKGGGLTTVTNEGVISASILPTNTGDATTGSTIALDLSTNTTGINLTQMVNPNPIEIETSTTTSSTGVVSTTAAITTATASTTTTTTVTTTGTGVTTTTTTTTPTFPEIIGDVLLGSGTNNVQLLGGSVTGALSLGGGVGDTLVIGDANDSVVYTGALTNQTKAGVAGTGLTLNVANGSLVNTATGTLNLSSLTVGAKGVLYAAVDPNNSANTLYQVTGAANIAAGGQLGITLKSPLFNEQTYTIITAAGGLTNGSADSVVLSQVPYLLVGTATTDTAAGTISVDLRRRTAAEIGLNPAESLALNAIYTSLPNDPEIESAFLNQYTRGGFLGLYDQMLPDYSGGVFQLALAASDAVTRATSRVNDIENPSGTRGAWAEEVAFGVDRSRNSQAAGYQGGGFGFVGGLEAGGAGFGAFGVTGSFLSGDLKDPHLPGDDLASLSEGEGGVYWQGQLGGFRADARVGAGYVLFSNRRELVQTNSAGETTLDRASKASSSGYSATGHFGLGYQTGQLGWFYFRPQVHGDYFRLNQGSYTEHNGGNGFDLAVNERDGDQTSGTASLVTGMSFGSGFKVKPELELGYRDVFTGNAGATVARFAAGGDSFSLVPPSIRGGGPVARLDMKADTDFYELNFEAGAEQRASFTEGDVRISVRVLF